MYIYGLSYKWRHQTICSYNWLYSKVKKVLQNQSAQDWRGIIDNLPKCINHKNFKKSNFTLGKYLLILPRDLRITFTEHNVVSCKSMCPTLWHLVWYQSNGHSYHITAMHIVLRLKKLAYHSYGSHRCLTLLTLCNGYQCQYILSLELRFIVKNTRALIVYH